MVPGTGNDLSYQYCVVHHIHSGHNTSLQTRTQTRSAIKRNKQSTLHFSFTYVNKTISRLRHKKE